MTKHLTADQDPQPKQLEKVSKIVKHLINSTGELGRQRTPEGPRSRRKEGSHREVAQNSSWHVQYLVGIW